MGIVNKYASPVCLSGIKTRRARKNRRAARPGGGKDALFLVVGLDLDALFVEVDEDLEGVIVLAGVPDFDISGRDLDDDLGVLVGVAVVAAPEVLFVELFKHI